MSDAAEPVGTAEDRSPECPTCGQLCADYKGRRVHERLARPEAFHLAEDRKLAARPKSWWDPEELALMAAFERAHPGMRAMNIAINREVLPHRTILSIKGKRRDDEYKALLNAGVISEVPSSDSESTREKLPGASPRPQPPTSPPAFDTETRGVRNHRRKWSHRYRRPSRPSWRISVPL